MRSIEPNQPLHNDKGVNNKKAKPKKAEVNRDESIFSDLKSKKKKSIPDASKGRMSAGCGYCQDLGGCNDFHVSMFA